MEKIFRTCFLTAIICCLLYIINPNTAYADEWINDDGELNVKQIQNYLYQAQPESSDGWFSYYQLDEELFLEVSKIGDMTVKSRKLQGLQLEYGNIHVPVGKEEGVAFVYSSEGALTIEGDTFVKYWYGQPIFYQKLSDDISVPQKIIKYKDEFLLVLSEGNVYTIDSNGQVYTLRSEGDVRVIALTNYLRLPDIQISIITNKGEWYYTIETHVGEWCFVKDNVIAFKCNGIVTTFTK